MHSVFIWGISTCTCVAINIQFISIVAEAVMGSLGVVAHLLTAMSSIATLIDICMHACIQGESHRKLLRVSYMHARYNAWMIAMLTITCSAISINYETTVTCANIGTKGIVTVLHALMCSISALVNIYVTYFVIHSHLYNTHS